MLPDFSPEEQAVIEELERRTTDCVTPKMLEDNYLFYRFAKARDFNLDEAERMLRENAAWRRELNIDTILTDYKPPEVLEKYVASSFVCFDKEGCAVRYVDAGRQDFKGLWRCSKKQDMVKYFSYRIEQDREAVKKRNGKLQKTILLAIFDFEDIPYSTITHMKSIQNSIGFFKFYFDSFPERLKYGIAINVPLYFLWTYSIIKPIFPAPVLRKIRMYGRDGWKEELLKLINADELPAFLGGNKTDPDGNPLCTTFVKRGEPIPKSFYMTKEKKDLGADFEKLTILPFSKQEISFEIKEANSTLEWEYDIKSRDIEFSLYFKGKTLETEELIPKQRIDTCYDTETGVFKCYNVGTYTMIFDNTYSWVYSKEVYFKATIKTPNVDNIQQ